MDYHGPEFELNDGPRELSPFLNHVVELVLSLCEHLVTERLPVMRSSWCVSLLAPFCVRRAFSDGCFLYFPYHQDVFVLILVITRKLDKLHNCVFGRS